jgi:RNA-directed DNA polymerase
LAMMNEVCALENLRGAFERVKKNNGGPGVDGETIGEFEFFREGNLARLAPALKSGNYQPQPVQRKYIPKPGSKEKRPLGIPTVTDRVVQAALLQVLEPIFEPGFADNSYGFRPGRGCLDALLQVDAGLKEGYVHVVDADIKAYFDTIPHEPLLSLVRLKVKDEQVIELTRSFLEAGVMGEDGLLEAQGLDPYQKLGTPQGGVISPLLANIYLDPLDHLMAALGFAMIRYADDFLVLCRTHSEAVRAKEVVNDWLVGASLTLHPTKTTIRDAAKGGDGFDFLGYHFDQDRRYPRNSSVKNLVHDIEEKTKGVRWKTLQAVIDKVNQVLRGWLEYFRYSTESRIFGEIDEQMISLLRKSLRRSQQGKWLPKSIFTKWKLFSLAEARSMVPTRFWN